MAKNQCDRCTIQTASYALISIPEIQIYSTFDYSFKKFKIQFQITSSLTTKT
jgi:hypothetical protein